MEKIQISLRDGSVVYGDKIDNKNDNVYLAIISNIIGQQLSIKAKKSIYNRFVALLGDVNAENIICTPTEEIRKCGISYSKISYIKEFSNDFLNNKYDFETLNQFNDFELINYLKRIKGVGTWTAEMIALFTLGRENIFSFDDVALKNGIMKAKGYKTLSKKRFESLRKKYTPYCSYASLYFYKLNDYEGEWKCTD